MQVCASPSALRFASVLCGYSALSLREIRKFLGTSLHPSRCNQITLQVRAIHRHRQLLEPVSTMPASTPVARSKTAALSRITDSIPKGYCRYTVGEVKPEKALALAQKLHQRHAIGATPAQRITRKSHGKANALLVLYHPDGAAVVHWLMLFTTGELDSHEQLRDVTRKPYLQWLGYELVRHPIRGRTAWTWRRPKSEMSDHYVVLDAALKKHHFGVVADHLQRIANQPGFHGVREQSWALCQHAWKKGYSDDLPTLYYVQKVSHGDRIAL